MNYLLRLIILKIIFLGIVFGLIFVNQLPQKIQNISSKESLKGFDLIIEFKKNVFTELEEATKKRDNERNRNN